MACRRFLCLLFLAVLVLAHNVAWADCPDGFVEIDGACYYFSEEKKDFEGATEDCSNLGGTLATFEDCENKDTVVNEPNNKEPCTYWTNPLTACVDNNSPETEENKFICMWRRNICEDDCRGKCSETLRRELPGFLCEGNFEWQGRLTECPCPFSISREIENCCTPVTGHSCEDTCGGVCMVAHRPPPFIGDGCDGERRFWIDCPCPRGMFCCVTPPEPGGN